jgi:hypothetical protein
LGGRCVCCGYNRSPFALDFHHVNPHEKVATISKIRSSHGSWATMVEELRKCVLLCANCHREVENGYLEVPPNATRFDESFVNAIQPQPSRRNLTTRKKICVRCHKEYERRATYCSQKCSASNQKRKVEVRPTKDELEKMMSELTWVEIGRRYAVSDNCIRKWAKAYQLL